MSEIYRAEVDPGAENNPHSYALRLVGGGQRVLEIGCSVGHVTEHLVAAGNTVVAVDIDRDAAAEASTWATRTHVRDLDREPLSLVESGPFDVVLMGDVLEHLRDPAAALRDFVLLLDDGGRLVLSVPHVAFIDIRLMLLEGSWAYQDQGLLDRSHLRWFTRESIRELLADVGFTASRVERVRMAPYSSGLPVTHDLHDAAVIRFIQSDPEALTYQFVVEARRGGDDALASGPVDWPDPAAERAELEAQLAGRTSELTELRAHNEALQAEVTAWRNSKIVRLAAPARSVWGRFKRRG